MIRNKIKVMVFMSLAASIALAAIANWSLRTIESASERKAALAMYLRSHMEADMMHDAIRGDVLIGLREASRYNTAGVNAAKTKLVEHTGNLNNYLQNSAQMKEALALEESIEEAQAELHAYAEKAAMVLDSALEDPLAAEKQYSLFEEKFVGMHEKLESISNIIEQAIIASEQEVKSLVSTINTAMLVITLVAVATLGMLCVQVFSRLLNPLQVSIQTMIQLSQGNLDAELNGAERKDEIGAMARAMQVFKENAEKARMMEKERSLNESRAQEEKKRVMQELALNFEQRVQGIISSVASASTQLLQTAQGMSGAIEEANNKAATVARSADTTTGNVQTVASAAEEMTASVKEISSQVTKSTQVVADTVAKAEHADSSAKELEGAAQQIGHVVQLIQDIAEQINLLALNATIESARAGDAGKGFAVVASEVKNLATQTTKATEEIASQIEGIQVISKSVVGALNAIKTSIDHVSEYAGGIASAVEEQSAVTDEIAANMQTAATGTNDIRVNINEVTSKAMSAKDAALGVLEASKSLSREAESLSREVAEFLSEIRS